MSLKENGGSKPSRYRWVMIGMFWAGTLGVALWSRSLGIMLPSMTQELGLTPVQAGWLGSVSWLGMTFLSIAFSWWMSRYSAVKLMAASLFLGALFVFLHGRASDYATLLATRILAVVAALIERGPVRALLIQKWFPPREIAQVNGFSTCFASGGVAVAVVLTPFLLVLLGGWRNTIYFMAAALFLVGIVWVLLAREREGWEGISTSTDGGTPLIVILKQRALWLVGFGLFGSEVVWGAYLTFWPTYLVDTFAMPLATPGLLLGLFQVGIVGGAFFSGFLSEWIGRRKPILHISGFALPLLCYSLLLTNSVSLLALLAVASGLAWISFPILNTIPYELPGMKPREIVVATALVHTILTVGGALGPLLVGVMYERTASLDLALGVASLFGFLVFIASLFIPETGRVAREAGKLEKATTRPTT
ncbi:MAG: MFS transporter [Chloroflexi bacterium]|nr:MFS transporter [Chloroflexota bacterium]